MGTPEGLWFVNPKMTGDINFDVTQISIKSLIKPRVISPYQEYTKGCLWLHITVLEQL